MYVYVHGDVCQGPWRAFPRGGDLAASSFGTCADTVAFSSVKGRTNQSSSIEQPRGRPRCRGIAKSTRARTDVRHGGPVSWGRTASALVALPSHLCYTTAMSRVPDVIPQRELRNHSGKILREAEGGRRFTITVDGRPVAELGPPRRRTWVQKAGYVELLVRRPVDPALFADLASFGGTLDELEVEA